MTPFKLVIYPHEYSGPFFFEPDKRWPGVEPRYGVTLLRREALDGFDVNPIREEGPIWLGGSVRPSVDHVKGWRHLEELQRAAKVTNRSFNCIFKEKPIEIFVKPAPIRARYAEHLNGKTYFPIFGVVILT